MTKICKKCQIEKDDSCFKSKHRVCKSCRAKLDYQSFKIRNLNPDHRNRLIEIRKNNRKENPWMTRFTASYRKLTGSSAYTNASIKTIMLMCTKRILSLIEANQLNIQQAKIFYNKLRSENHTQKSLMDIVKQIFNLPKVTGGINART